METNLPPDILAFITAYKNLAEQGLQPIGYVYTNDFSKTQGAKIALIVSESFKQSIKKSLQGEPLFHLVASGTTDEELKELLVKTVLDVAREYIHLVMQKDATENNQYDSKPINPNPFTNEN